MCETDENQSVVRELDLPLIISLLKNKADRTVGFKASVAKTKNILATAFCENFARNYRESGIVVRVVGESLVFDESLCRGRKWLVPLTIPQMQELVGIFKNATAYIHEGCIVKDDRSEDRFGFRFVSPGYIAECVNELYEKE